MKIPEIKMVDGKSIPALGLGTWELTGEKCMEAVKIALGLGYRHIDTADFYANHKEIAKAIKGVNRSELFITSKLWTNQLKKEFVRENCERFLKELHTDYLDLLLIHWPNWRVPVKETLEAMQELQNQGIVQSIGVSNFSIAQLEEALEADVKIATNQVEFHPGHYQRELLEYCNSKKVVITAYSPIARGSALNDAVIKEIAEKYGKTPAQVCLRWLVQKGLVVIPKASSRAHLQENMQIFGWKLKEQDEKRIDMLGKSVSRTVFRKLLTTILPFHKT